VTDRRPSSPHSTKLGRRSGGDRSLTQQSAPSSVVVAEPEQLQAMSFEIGRGRRDGEHCTAGLEPACWLRQLERPVPTVAAHCP
jgi:hypothetical protein